MSGDEFKLALARYIYKQFGYRATQEEGPFEKLSEKFIEYGSSDTIDKHTEWHDAADGTIIKNEEAKVSKQEIDEYDRNISEHLRKINKSRDGGLSLRYYQYISLLMTEYVLDNLSNRPNELIQDFNSYIKDDFWQVDKTYDTLSFKNPEEFSKLAYWMATGSGKTYLLHINYLQYRDYFGEESFDNAILIAPTESVAQQHIEELEMNGINSSMLSNTNPNELCLQVTDINKLSVGESGPKTTNIEELGKNNLIFVDEGHKGLGSLNSTNKDSWVNIRDSLSDDGFAFEYSATFASSLSDSKGYNEYSKTIVFDYPYGRFHKDEYGKDFNIVNISPSKEDKEFIDSKRDEWLLANLLTYYEKLHVYENRPHLMEEYNIERPLSVFVGNSVNAIQRGNSSDVQVVVEFLQSLIENKNNWAKELIQNAINKDGIFSNGDVFGEQFRIISRKYSSPSELYNSLITSIFNSENPSQLELVRLKNLDDEEIGISTDTTESFFGVVTIGDTKEFADLIEESENNIRCKENEVHSKSLFGQIDDKNSSTDILIGSKKFAEGWDSTRPSSMGLLNIGTSKGPFVVQMFGRGVRVSGENDDGKRTPKNKIPSGDRVELSRLQTLDVFGVRADYMETFRDYLESERVSIDKTKTVEIGVDKPETNSDLVVPVFDTKSETPQTLALKNTFDEDNFTLKDFPDEDPVRPNKFKPQRNEVRKTSRITSSEDEDYDESRHQSEIVTVDVNEDFKLKCGDEELDLPLDVLDWDSVWHSALEHKNKRGYSELIVDKNSVRRIISEGRYDWGLPSKNTLEVNSLEDSEVWRVESLCARIVCQYIDNVYSAMVDDATGADVSLEPLDNHIDEYIPEKYELEIKKDTLDRIIKNNTSGIDDMVKDDKIEIDTKDMINRLGIDGDSLIKRLKYLYEPVLLSKKALEQNKGPKNNDDIKSISPEGIENTGERNFLKAVSAEAENGILEDSEVIVMRNQVYNGVEAPSSSGFAYPDFVIWMTHDGIQHIILADPHGVVSYSGRSLIEDLKRINGKSPKLSENSGLDVEAELHACVFARTKAGNTLEDSRQEIRNALHINEDERLQDNNIFTVDDKRDDLKRTREEVRKMFEQYVFRDR